ncbi:carbohydrate esterase family 2 protein [Ceratobasidium sp. AG-Ba]|nr:carbohydrate esterase family 2 protein [Ceratobasidium sp. AG-Ba]
MRTSWIYWAALLVGKSLAATSPSKKPVVILPNSPLLHKHGRWDMAPGTWWAGSGFKLVASSLTSLTLHLGNHTTAPQLAAAFSIDYANFTTINVTAGANIIPIPPPGASTKNKNRAVRINVEGWQNNRMHLEKIELNAGAVVTPYRPSPLRFQFIGDSLSAGQYNPRGVNDAWTFLTAQAFKAEHSINAQPGACLVDQLCWGNIHGVSHQYFETEDTGYYYTTDHNYTTPWDFRKDLTPTHIVIAIGANDNAYNITPEAFSNTLATFTTKLRTLYRQQPLFVFTPWGWPQGDGESPFSTYYDGVYEDVVKKRTFAGDKNIHLVNTTGWVAYDGVYPVNVHPNPLGHQQVVDHFTAWLKKWGLQPRSHWES